MSKRLSIKVLVAAIALLWATGVKADTVAQPLGGRIAAELVSTLTPTQQGFITGLVVVQDIEDVGVNAYAGCSDLGTPIVVLTSGLLAAALSLAITTEISPDLKDSYTRYAVAKLNLDELPMVPKTWLPGWVENDPSFWGSVRERFGSILALVLGHELGHHVLGHTKCGGKPEGSTKTTVRRTLPVLNQELETDADIQGTINMLETAVRYGHRWNESGGVLLFEFFGALERSTAAGHVGYFRTHPRSTSRIAVLKAAAATWRIKAGLPQGVR
jgi:hypothetical protein